MHQVSEQEIGVELLGGLQRSERGIRQSRRRIAKSSVPKVAG